jgi:hypothetical protein
MQAENIMIPNFHGGFITGNVFHHQTGQTTEPSKNAKRSPNSTLTLEAGSRLVAQKEAVAQNKSKKQRSSRGADGGEPAQRRCKRYSRIGHNARTCQIEEKEPIEIDSPPEVPSDCSNSE